MRFRQLILTFDCFLWLDYHSVHQHNRTLQTLAIITLPFYCLVCLFLGRRWFVFFSSQFVLFSNFAHECIPIVDRQIGYRRGVVHVLVVGFVSCGLHSFFLSIWFTFCSHSSHSSFRCVLRCWLAYRNLNVFGTGCLICCRLVTNYSSLFDC